MRPKWDSGDTNATDHEMQRERLTLLAKLLDQDTVRLLEALDVRAGMRCLEVGGGGSVANWLRWRVGPGGVVLTTDLDAAVAAEPEHPKLELRDHDLRPEALPEQVFDLVHGRLVLARLADPKAGLRRLVAALRPGGSLLLEELDFISLAPDPGLDPRTGAIFTRVIEAHNAILARERSFDPYFGRRLAGELADAGLVNTGYEGRSSFWHGGEAGGRIWQLTLLQLRESIIGSGLAGAEEIDTALELCADPGVRFLSPVTVAAWGYRRLSARHGLSALARA